MVRLNTSSHQNLRRPAHSQEGWFKRNAAVEAFWTHARNLIEFLTRPKSADLTISSASAKNFAASFFSNLGVADTLITKIKEQISHLGFKRRAAADAKLGSILMNWLKPAIDADIKRFEEGLDEDCRRYWTYRHPTQFVFVSPTHTTSAAGPSKVSSALPKKMI